ncbi:uncharacterized protein LOC132759422 [Ruditapes philippinarum]|uniref:uncharacterized protein LOC132759422 n=1 Tax=Ruditapes philippinarum TaxID=129788 RepID=UPI00295B0776|nr:uncharacterized protein LOC132759422 [Ruditapes philippinarum]
MIVKCVESVSENRAKLKLIHFKKSDEKEIKITESTETFDLRYDEVYLVEYRFPLYSPNEIIKRAESMLPKECSEDAKFKKYNLLTGNCEHFAVWCVTGRKESIQIQGLFEKIKDGATYIFGPTSAVSKGVQKIILNSVDEIAAELKKAVPSIVVSGIAAVYLIYCVIMTAVNIKYYTVDKTLCWSCLKKKLLKLWLSLVVFGITSGIQLIIYTFALPLISSPLRIPFMILIILLSVGLQMSVPSLIRPLQSPIFGHDIFLKSTDEINVGDLLELKYFKLPHIILVTEVHSEKVRAIHYAAPSHPFARRIVKEEYFSINSSSVKKKYMLSKCYPPNVVVERARKRLGETKFNMWSNRSSHLCNWAKVDLRAESVSGVDDHSLDRPKSNNKSSLKVCNREVHLVDELEEGDVVILDKINMLPFWVSDKFPFMSPFMVPFILMNTYVQGIVLDIKGNREESITLELLIHIGVQVCRVRVHIDLKTERLFVCKYLEGHCKSMRDRVTAALEMANKWQIFFTNKAFVEACVMRHPE